MSDGSSASGRWDDEDERRALEQQCRVLAASLDAMTKERDSYREGLKKQLAEKIKARAQLAASEVDRARLQKAIMDAIDIATGHAEPMPSLWRVEEHLRAAMQPPQP